MKRGGGDEYLVRARDGRIIRDRSLYRCSDACNNERVHLPQIGH